MAKQKQKFSSKNVLKLIVLFGTMLAIGVASPHFHSQYLLSKVGSQTVYIRSPKGAELQGSATGFEVKASSGRIYTLTNAHVCGLQKDGYVLVGDSPSSDKLLAKRILKVYRDNDLCLVEGVEGYSGLSLADSYDTGDLNYVIGYAMGEEQNFSQGYIKGKAIISIPEMEIPTNECNGPYQSVQGFQTFLGLIEICTVKRYSIATSISIWPGNSGSAMVNVFGNVTGVIFAGDTTTFWGFAVPLEDVRDFLRSY